MSICRKFSEIVKCKEDATKGQKQVEEKTGEDKEQKQGAAGCLALTSTLTCFIIFLSHSVSYVYPASSARRKAMRPTT